MPGVFKQAVLVLRWSLEGARLVQPARDNGISLPTTYRCLHEGLTVLADHAPGLSAVPERAAAAGCTHLNPDGTVIRTDEHPGGRATPVVLAAGVRAGRSRTAPCAAPWC